MTKGKCKRCNNQDAGFDEKRQRYFSCLPCLQEIKSQNKIAPTNQASDQSNVNEVYRRKLRLFFLSELQKVKPNLFQEVENQLAENYKDDFGTDFGDFQDVVSDESYAETFTSEFCDFALLFVNWLNKWNLKNNWIAEFFLNQLSRKDFANIRPNLPAQMYFLPSKFEFEFPGIKSDIETEKEYRKRFDAAFKLARINHFDSIKNAKSDFINFSVKQKHIKWLIDYHFEKKTFQSIAEIEQFTYHGVTTNEAIRKAINQIAADLPFPIKK